MSAARSAAYRAVEAVERRHAAMIANASLGAAEAIRRQGPDYVALPASVVRELLQELATLSEAHRELKMTLSA